MANPQEVYLSYALPGLQHRRPEPVSGSDTDSSSKTDARVANLTPNLSTDRPNDAGSKTRTGGNMTNDLKNQTVYQRRLIVFAFVIALNFISGFERSSFAPIAKTVASHFDVSYQALNTFALANGIAKVISALFAVWTLNQAGPKGSLVASCVLHVIGSWTVFAATSTKDFMAYAAGTIIVSMSAMIAFAMPIRYSRLWFSEKGRTTSTALGGLSGPAGAAIGTIFAPHIIQRGGLSGLSLIYTTVVTATCSASAFLPYQAATPASNRTETPPPLEIWQSIKLLFRNKPFYFKLYGFAVSFAAFESTTSLTMQIIVLYECTQNQAGLANGLAVICGVVTACVVCAVVDRTEGHLDVIKSIVMSLAGAHTILLFIPQTKALANMYIFFSPIGALSLITLPLALELQANWTSTASHEASNSAYLTGGLLLTAAFVIVEEALVPRLTSLDAQPAEALLRGNIFVAAMMWSVVPFAVLTGFGIFKRPNAPKPLDRPLKH